MSGSTTSSGMSANLISPGVKVSVINESFYGAANQGSIPLIVLATSANKTAPSGTGIAPYTAPDLANTLYLATSQRDLLANFGNPVFQVSEGTPLNGSELNEYGLHAAYSFLGLANQCYILRADIDLSELESSTSAPTSAPTPGTYWLNLSNSTWGAFISNGNSIPGSAWITQNTIIPNQTQVDSTFTPLSSFGINGNIAVVPWTTSNLMFQKINGTWYQIGSSAWTAANPTIATGVSSPALVNAGDIFSINGVSISMPANGETNNVSETINSANIPNITSTVINNAIVITNTAGGNIVFQNITGTSLTILGFAAGTINGVQVYYTNDASYPANSAAGSVWIKGSQSNNGAQINIQYYSGKTNAWITLSTPWYQYNSTVADGVTGKDNAAIAALGANVAVGNVYVGFDPNTGSIQFRRWNGTSWAGLTYEADYNVPFNPPIAGVNWYNADVSADIMVSNGSEWLGYASQFPNTDPNGVQIAGTAPTTQSTGAPLVNNDLWIDSTDLENYPMIYRYSVNSMSWVLVNNTDNQTPFGIIFADARQDSGPALSNTTATYALYSTATSDLVNSNYVDPDAPDPRFYPAGMLMFNTRFSNGNVKQWNPTYFKAGNYSKNTDYTLNGYNVGTAQFPALASPARWVTASGNQENGAPYMLRKAQRVMVVKALAASLNNNQDILSELVYFNLMAVPGYIELLPDMVTVNTNLNEVAFIVADTPARLTPDSQSISNWANNVANVPADGENGLVTHSDYAALYYPWGLGQDAAGDLVMIPPSTIALRTIAYSDQISYPWMAPAGFQRGLVTNATSVGYLDDSTINGGTYNPTILNPGQRDILYSNNINPIAYIPGRGLVVYGQKTIATEVSLMDRINVARLACYIAYNLDLITKPFLFEQNDASTRNSASNTVSQFFNTLIGLRAISDYAVVCDTTNNTAATIDANQLWIDCVILPITSIEFIYIPVRIESNSSYSGAVSGKTNSSSSMSNNINVSQ